MQQHSMLRITGCSTEAGSVKCSRRSHSSRSASSTANLACRLHIGTRRRERRLPGRQVPEGGTVLPDLREAERTSAADSRSSQPAGSEPQLQAQEAATRSHEG